MLFAISTISATTRTGALEKDCPITTISGKRTNTFTKVESCFPRGQVSWNDFKVLNGCIIVF